MKMVPRRRFKGFSEEWEERKLRNLLVSEIKGKAKAEMLGNESIYLDATYLNGGQKFYVNSPQDVEKKDVIILWDGSQAGKVYHGFEGALGSTFKAFKPEFSGSFLYQYLVKNQMLIFLKYRTPNIPHVIKDFTSEFNVFYPLQQEQNQIGSFFSNLDNLITLHQRKFEKLQALKRAYLTEMFPQEGEKVPRRRFKGFTGPWEERRLGEICDDITVGIANSATHAYSDYGVVMFRNQNIKPNYLDDEDLVYINSDFEKRYINKRLKENDLLIVRTGYPGTACIVPKEYEGSQTFTTLIARLNKEVNPYYICQYINSDGGKEYFSSTQIGGGQKNSGAGILEKLPLFIPEDISEQKQIGSFFSHLDNLIILHQRKLEKLQDLKKAYLSEMFV